MSETELDRDARIRAVIGQAEQVAVSFALADVLGEVEAAQDWADRFYDVLAVGLGVDPCGDTARALALLVAERGWYQDEAARVLDGLREAAP